MEIVPKQGNWEEFKIKLGKKYPQLKESDLNFSEGMKKNMMRMIEYKLGMTKQELRKIIAEL